jgi:hypothetical protein
MMRLVPAPGMHACFIKGVLCMIVSASLHIFVCEIYACDFVTQIDGRYAIKYTYFLDRLYRTLFLKTQWLYYVWVNYDLFFIEGAYAPGAELSFQT